MAASGQFSQQGSEPVDDTGIGRCGQRRPERLVNPNVRAPRQIAGTDRRNQFITPQFIGQGLRFTRVLYPVTVTVHINGCSGDVAITLGDPG